MDLELNISFTHTHALCIVEYNVSARLVISLSALPVGLLVSYLCALPFINQMLDSPGGLGASAESRVHWWQSLDVPQPLSNTTALK